MIPQSFIQELLSRVDLVEIINKVVPLKKTGKNYMACCPFHKEKTPSFSVSPQKQFYKCFGCGASGSAIGFVMQYEGLGYVDAIKRLAEMVGMTVPEEPGAARRHAQARTLTDLMGLAQAFYTDALKQNQRCIDYLKLRGITGETAARFGLGYSPDGWQSLKDIFGDQYESDQLQEVKGCGLVIRNDEGRCYDRFRGRLMYPIRNPRGQVIGFGARTLNGDEHPKYLNSPETAIYHKGMEIYGLFEGHDAIRENGRAIVCEGYMDVIQLSQAGFRESVAALGTSITSDHVKKLFRMVDKVYFSFDGDAAGQHALRRAMEATITVIGDSQEARFVVLPPSHDPDSLIKERGHDGFEAELASSLTLTQYFVKTVTENKNLATPEGRSQFLAEAKPLVVAMRSAPLLRGQLVAELSMHARMSPDELERAFGIATVPIRTSSGGRTSSLAWRGDWNSSRRRKEDVARIEPVKTADKRERLLQNLLNFPELAVEFSGRIEEQFVARDDEFSEKIVEVWRAVNSDEQPVLQTHLILESLMQSPYAEHYRRLVGKELVLQTSYEIARTETIITLDRLELEDIGRLLEAETRKSQPNLGLIRALYDKRRMLTASIEQVAREIDDAV